MDMREQVIRLLCQVADVDRDELEDDMDLFEDGILDSLGFISLLVELEDHLGVKIEPTEVERGDINTPDKLARYVTDKAEAAGLL